MNANKPHLRFERNDKTQEMGDKATRYGKGKMQLGWVVIPQSRLAEGITHARKISHHKLEVGVADFRMLEQRDEDVLVGLGVPGLHLAAGLRHDVE